jgi:hypothetical protein
VSAVRHVLFVAGFLAIVVLLSRLPADDYATTQAVLLAASGVLLLLLAAASVLTPARRALGRLFGFPVRERPRFAPATSEEWRDLLRVVLGALVLLAAAGLPTLLR